MCGMYEVLIYYSMECQEIEHCRNSKNTQNVFTGLVWFASVHFCLGGVKTDFKNWDFRIWDKLQQKHQTQKIYMNSWSSKLFNFPQILVWMDFNGQKCV